MRREEKWPDPPKTAESCAADFYLYHGERSNGNTRACTTISRISVTVTKLNETHSMRSRRGAGGVVAKWKNGP